MNLLKILPKLDDDDILHINVWLCLQDNAWNTSHGRDVIGFLPFERVKEAAEHWATRHGLRSHTDPHNVTRNTAIKLFGE